MSTSYARWVALSVVATVVALMGCDRQVVQPTPATSAPPTPSVSSATPTPTPSPTPNDVEQAMSMYRDLDDLQWQYLTQRNGMGADEAAPTELTDLLTGDALSSEVSYLRRWRAQGWKVVSGKQELRWMRDLENDVTWGASVLVIQACNDASNVITTNASGKRIENKASVTTVFYERVDGELRISYFDRTQVGAVAACGPSASPSPSS